MLLRWPPIVGCFLQIVCAIFVIYFELNVFLGYRSVDLEWASNENDIVTPKGECVAYASPKAVDKEYNGSVGTFNLFGFPLGGQNVTCELEHVRSDLALLVVASVHPLRHAVNSGTEPVTEITNTYAVAATFALGGVAELEYASALKALAALPEPPPACAQIYGTDPTTPPSEPEDPLKVGEDMIQCEPVVPIIAAPDAGHDGVLHAHCLAQFELGRYNAKRDPWTMDVYYEGVAGTLGLPVYGDKTTPVNLPWPSIPGLNSTSTPREKTRIYTGTRFGMSAFGSTIGIALAAFLLFDGIFAVTAELTLYTRFDALRNNAPTGPDGESQLVTAMFALYATSAVMRKERVYYGLLAWILLLLARSLFLWGPWNFGHLLPRPECKDDGKGWLLDTEATALEVTSTVTLLASLFVQPFSRLRMFAINYVSAYEEKNYTLPKFSVPSSWTVRSRLLCALAGILVGVAAQASVAILVGAAWAESVTDPQPNDWSSRKYADVTFGKTLGALGIGLSGGVAVAAVLSRWLFAGRSLVNCFSLLLWALVASVAGLPLVLVESFTLSEEEFSRDCSQLDEGSAQRATCEARFYVYFAGMALLFGPLLLMLLNCCFRNACVLCMPRRGQTVRPGPFFARFRRETARQNRMTTAPEMAPLMPALHLTVH